MRLLLSFISFLALWVAKVAATDKLHIDVLVGSRRRIGGLAITEGAAKDQSEVDKLLYRHMRGLNCLLW